MLLLCSCAIAVMAALLAWRLLGRKSWKKAETQHRAFLTPEGDHAYYDRRLIARRRQQNNKPTR